MDQVNTRAAAHINKKLAKRLDPSAPDPWVIETYLVAIADNFKVPFEADPAIVAAGKIHPGKPDADLLNLQQMGEFGNNNQPPPGGFFPGAGGNFQTQSYPVAPEQPQFAQTTPIEPSAPVSSISKPKSTFNYPKMGSVKQPPTDAPVKPRSEGNPLDAVYSQFPQEYNESDQTNVGFDYGNRTSQAYANI